MLHLAGELPSYPADMASLDTVRSPLFEELVRLFAQRLSGELRRGVPHQYRTREENLGVLRGKLVFGQHLRQNLIRKDRFSVAHDEWSPDGVVARVLRATVRLLLRQERRPATQRALVDAYHVLNGVSDVPVTVGDIDQIPRSRQLVAFEPLLAFCRLVIGGLSPAFGAGDDTCFALLFDMNLLYERFLEGFIKRHVMAEAGMAGYTFHPQAVGHTTYLLHEHRGDKARGVLRLAPDLLFRRDDGRLAILDAKWKILGGRAAREDLYQMFGYAHRYRASCTLLYPSFDGAGGSDEEGDAADAESREMVEALKGGARYRVDVDDANDKTRWIRAARLDVGVSLNDRIERDWLCAQLVKHVLEAFEAQT